MKDPREYVDGIVQALAKCDFGDFMMLWFLVIACGGAAWLLYQLFDWALLLIMLAIMGPPAFMWYKWGKRK